MNFRIRSTHDSAKPRSRHNGHSGFLILSLSHFILSLCPPRLLRDFQHLSDAQRITGQSVEILDSVHRCTETVGQKP